MGTFQYASIFRRVVAFMLDLPFIIILYYLCDSICVFLHDAWGTMFSTYLIMYIVVIAVYFCGFECSSHQGSIGKMVVGIQIYTHDTKEGISYTKALLRFLVKIISFIIFPLSILLIILTKKHQALHDLIAGTIIVREE